MKAFTIEQKAAGRTLGRYLELLLPGAPRSLFFKALRENKIKLNGRKPADLKVPLAEGDELKLFLTEEQFAAFGAAAEARKEAEELDPSFLRIAFENDRFLVLNKPAGLLSQKDESGEPSLNEYALSYLRSAGYAFQPGFTPGVLNRLDRNTAGCVLMAKDLPTAQYLSKILADKSLGKYYLAVTEGRISWDEKELRGFWTKDGLRNRVTLSSEKTADAKEVCCRVRVLARTVKGADRTLVEVRLLSGKSHQIRAQLSAEGYPLVGDFKYGARALGPEEKTLQLFARRLVFPDGGRIAPEVSAEGASFEVACELPAAMRQYLKRHFPGAVSGLGTEACGV